MYAFLQENVFDFQENVKFLMNKYLLCILIPWTTHSLLEYNAMLSRLFGKLDIVKNHYNDLSNEPILKTRFVRSPKIKTIRFYNYILHINIVK